MLNFFAVSSESSLFYAIYNIAHAYYRYWPLLLLVFGGIIGVLVIQKKQGEKFKFLTLINKLGKQEYPLYLILNIIVGTVFFVILCAEFC